MSPRINFSHGDPASWQRLVYTVRAAQEIVGKPVAIVGDLQGPKIRIGEVPQPFEVVRNERLTIVAGSNRPAGRSEGHYAVACPYGALIDEVRPGEHIYLRDGEIELRGRGRERRPDRNAGARRAAGSRREPACTRRGPARSSTP